MNENENKPDLGPFVNEHSKLWEFCWKIYSIENLLKNDKFRYIYLANLISSDTIVDKQSSKNAINELTFIKQNIEYFNIEKETKKEIKKFVNGGIRVAKQELNKYKKAE